MYQQLAVGQYHACGILGDGTLSCWGANQFGQLNNVPTGTFRQVSAGRAFACGLQTDGAIACWGQSIAGETNPPMGSFTEVSAGAYHTCAVRTDGSIACWGYNATGQTNVPSELTVPANVVPAANAGGPYFSVEGTAVSFDGTGSSDVDGDALVYAWDFGDGATSSGANATHVYQDNGTYPVSLTVTDGKGGSHTAGTSVTISNAAPTVTSISLGADPVPVNTSTSLSAAFSDQGTADTHTASINWGASSSSGSVAEANGSGTVAGTHTYTAAGVYTVQVSVTDKDGASGIRSSTLDIPAYVVVYDPSAGIVSGGGWIDSPERACRFNACTDQTIGKATFGFVSRYKQGATTPSGNTEFQFKAGGLTFKSTTYQWLVVAGARAQCKGEGTINGTGSYGSLLTAIDGQISGGGGTDKFRIKIWDKASGNAAYDNQMGQGEDSDAATSLGGGSIVIHK